MTTATEPEATDAAATVTDVELSIGGMTCASCANRIERKLNKLDGVSASVNYATEKATVDFDAGATAPRELVAAVEAAGYGALLPSAGPEPGAAEGEPDPTAPSCASPSPATARRSRPSRTSARAGTSWRSARATWPSSTSTPPVRA